jgi:SAM-dependent methyltransferase
VATARRLRAGAGRLVQRAGERAVGWGRRLASPVPLRGFHRYAVGGMWEEMGRHQLDFLVGQGLRPGDRLLDVGCGSLRGGLHLIGYLDPGGYYGIDTSPLLLAAGRRELVAAGLEARRPTLLEDSDFAFGRFGTTFDVLLAQSLFSHLPINSIQRCLIEAVRVLRPDGCFYATFFEGPDARIDQAPVRRHRPDATFATYPDRDPFHYPRDVWDWLCTGLGLEPRYIGAWGGPSIQMMMEFRRTG